MLLRIEWGSLVELCTLPGIGPKKAEAIIAAREKRRFTRVTQLLRVKGIGLKTIEDALTMRARVLGAFERAEATELADRAIDASIVQPRTAQRIEIDLAQRAA